METSMSDNEIFKYGYLNKIWKDKYIYIDEKMSDLK